MPPSLKPLSQQVIVITGASSGIGLATARKAAEAGAKVVLVARNADVLKAIVLEIESGGGQAAYAIADVGERAEVEAAAALAVQRFGRIDTWVSNAGVAIYSDLLTTPRDEHERLFRANYWDAVNCAEIAVGALKTSGGALIVVGSIASEMGSAVMGAYVASKHAVKGYVDSLRIELARDKVPVSVTLIKPAGVGTPLNAHVANHREGEAKIPPPVYSPDLVADVILDAAERPVRERYVGEAGVAQVMIATHFPGLFARIAGAIPPLLNDPKTLSTPGDNLFGPASGGRSQGEGVKPRAASLYTAAELHPRLASALALIAGAGVAAVIKARRKGSAARPVIALQRCSVDDEPEDGNSRSGVRLSSRDVQSGASRKWRPTWRTLST